MTTSDAYHAARAVEMTEQQLEAIRPLIEDIMGAMGFELVQLEPKGAGFCFSWRRVDGQVLDYHQPQ